MQQQGLRSLVWALGIAVALLALSACDEPPPGADVLAVTTAADGADAAPGDGVCEMTAGSGDCSVRAAFDEANAAPTTAWITIPSGTYALTGGPLVADSPDHSIIVLAPGGARLDADGAPTVIDHRAGVLLAYDLGLDDGTHALTTGNGATTTLVRSTLMGSDAAGAVVEPGGALTLSHSTVTSNQGGGIDSDGTLTLTYATVTANQGGGIAGSGTTTTSASVIADQVSGVDCAAAVTTSSGWNLDSDATCGLGHADDLTSATAALRPLDGAPNASHGPSSSSPLLDAIPATASVCAGAAADQRHISRPLGDGCDPGAVETDTARHLVVDDPSDEPDLVPGDSACTTAGGGCTLRAAIDETNHVVPGPSTGDTITLAVDATLTDGDLDTTAADLTIDGGGHTVDGGGVDRVLHAQGSGRLTIRDAALTGGTTPDGGGAILHSDGDLIVEDSWIHGNTARAGGAVLTDSPGTLRIESTTIDANEATGMPEPTAFGADTSGHGGAVLDRGGSVEISNSTISGNTAAVGAVVSAAPQGGVAIASSTIADNTGGGVARITSYSFCHPIYGCSGGTTAAAVSLHGTVLANPPSTSSLYGVLGNCFGTMTSLGWNVSDASGCNLGSAGDRTAVPTLLTPLADNGGLGPTHVPWEESPVVDAIPLGTPGLCDGTIPTDQRGAERPEGAACDIGAVEGDNGLGSTPLTLVVDTALDGSDADPGDGTCDTGSGDCSLRAAIDEANTWPAVDTVSIAPGIDPVLSLAGAGDDANATGDLDVLQRLELDGNGATVDAGGLDRALHLVAVGAAPRGAVVRDVTLTGGSADRGGAVHDAKGEAELVDVTVTGNTATSQGGGIYSASPDLELTDVSLTANSAPDGAGAHLRGGTISGSTISGNTATAAGGGIWTNGTTTVDGSTLSGNIATTTGGAIDATGGTVTVRDSTLSGNRAGVASANPLSNGTSGGAIRLAGSGSLVVDGSTLAGNQAGNGGAIAATRPLTLLGTTLSGNTSGNTGAVHSTGTGSTATSTTFAGNTTLSVDQRLGTRAGSAVSGNISLRASVLDGVGRECTPNIDLPGTNGTLVSLGYNVVADGSCGSPAATDVTGVDALLGPLAVGGGPTATHLPSSSSAAIGIIPAGTPELCEGPSPCNAGAAAGSGPAVGPPLTLEVTTDADAVDLVPGDGACTTSLGACSLRAAVTETNTHRGPDTITVAPGRSPRLQRAGTNEDTNATGDLDVTDHLTVVGGGAILRDSTSERVFHVLDDSLTLDEVTLRSSGWGIGSGALGIGDLTLERSHVDDEGVLGRTHLAIIETTVEGSVGTGVFLGEDVRATVERSTISGHAGAGFTTMPITPGSAVSLTVADSTISGNGLGAINLDGTATVTRSTIAGNLARDANSGAGIQIDGGSATVSSTILDNAASNCANAGTLPTSGGHNLDSNSSCELSQAGDVSGAAVLAPLADNGGPTATHLPSASSPAVDAIAPGTAGACDISTPADQRGVARPAGAGCDIGAVEGAGPAVGSLTLTVDTSADAPDATPGDRTCDIAAGGCSLRAAVDEANASPSGDTIVIAAGVDPVLSRAGAGDDANATGDLDSVGDLTIDGGGATIDAAGLDRVLDHRLGTLTAEDVTLRGGSVTGDGGGMRVDGPLALTRVTVSDNTVTASGGGIHVSSGPAAIVDSTVSGNAAGSAWPGWGGGISANGAAVSLLRSTISENAAYVGGGVHLESSPPMTVTASTFHANSAVNPSGQAINGPAQITSSTLTGHFGPTITSSSSTIAGSILISLGGHDCEGHPAATSLGHNVFGDTSCGSGATDVVADPLLSLPGDHGGPTPTRLPYASSPVIDAIPIGTPGLCTGALTDQRGVARPAGGGCDIGAVEGASPGGISPLSLEVDTAADAPDAVPGDGLCDTGSGTCSLRAAIDEANAWVTDDVVTIGAGVDPVLSIPGTNDDSNATGDLDITDDLVISGGGATVDAAGLDRVVHHRGGSLTLEEVTLTGGSIVVSQGRGGGLLSTGGFLRIDRSTIVGNTVSGYTGAGGGLALLKSRGTLIDRSTISGNVASTSSGYGGGIWHQEADGLTIRRTTISGNSAYEGSAVRNNIGTYGQPVVEASTIVANVGEATLYGGAQLRGSIVVASEGGAACVGTVISGGANRIGDTTCGATAAGDQQGVAPLLGPLADNGGPTRTHLPYANSPGVDAIAPGTASLCDGVLPTDQRGVARPAGPGCDVGAVEGTNGITASPRTFVVDSAADAVDAALGDGACNTGTGTCTLRAAVGESNAWPADDTISIAPGVNPVLSIPGRDEDANASGDLDVVDSVVIDGGGATISGASIDRVIHHLGGSLHLAETTVTGGRLVAAGSRGGGISSVAGDLVVTDSTIRDNRVSGGDGRGGGLSIQRTYEYPGTALVDRSTFSGNVVDTFSASGGAIHSDGFAVTTVLRSTFSANRAFYGAGIQAEMGYGTGATRTRLVATTLVGNLGATSTQGTVDLLATVVVHGGTGSACGSGVASLGYNVALDTTCPFSQLGDLEGVDPLLGPLAANGGPTMTHRPTTGSPVIDRVPSGTAGVCNASLPADQRGVARPLGPGCDSGAVEGPG